MRQITWDDLVPELPPIEDPFTHLTMDQRVLLAGIAGLRIQIRDGQLPPDSRENEMAAEDIQQLKKEGLDVDALLRHLDDLDAEIERRNRTVVDTLDGQLVRLPGYALPLDLTEFGVTEFLLVPFIGACIHVPPPPANQTVLVRLKQTYVAKDIFEPVWITGRMKIQRTSNPLYLTDGTSDVSAAYVLDGTKVEPYKN